MVFGRDKRYRGSILIRSEDIVHHWDMHYIPGHLLRFVLRDQRHTGGQSMLKNSLGSKIFVAVHQSKNNKVLQGLMWQPQMSRRDCSRAAFSSEYHNQFKGQRRVYTTHNTQNIDATLETHALASAY